MQHESKPGNPKRSEICSFIKQLQDVLCMRNRDVGSILNLEGHDTSWALFSEEEGALSRNIKGTSLFIAKSWGARAPSAPGGHVPPVPTSMLRILLGH